ncbi:hypothetical protein HOY82DRAFT_601222 [Tuber indicum]|nr:hypothetical protein HOY82DRAFT_601222 [Tuber indicum]
MFTQCNSLHMKHCGSQALPSESDFDSDYTPSEGTTSCINIYWRKLHHRLNTALDTKWNLQVALLKENTRNMRLRRAFTLLGALERIAYEAHIMGKISSSGGIQLGLIKISQLLEFQSVLQREVKIRGLVFQDIHGSIRNLYTEVQKRRHPPSHVYEISR